MTQWLVAIGIAGLAVGYFAGKEHGSRMVFAMWRRSKQRGPGGCVHNVIAERAYPKGDRTVCEDCGESDPSFDLPKEDSR